MLHALQLAFVFAGEARGKGEGAGERAPREVRPDAVLGLLRSRAHREHPQLRGLSRSSPAIKRSLYLGKSWQMRAWCCLASNSSVVGGYIQPII